jgi:hypothetical protein
LQIIRWLTIPDLKWGHGALSGVSSCKSNLPNISSSESGGIIDEETQSLGMGIPKSIFLQIL